MDFLEAERRRRNSLRVSHSSTLRPSTRDALRRRITRPFHVRIPHVNGSAPTIVGALPKRGSCGRRSNRRIGETALIFDRKCAILPPFKTCDPSHFLL